MTFISTALRIASSILVWALHFGLLYASTTFSCARKQTTALPWIIGLTTLLAVIACLVIIWRSWQIQPRIRLQAVDADDADDSDEFERWLTVTVAALALLAVLWQALPALLVDHPCG